MTNGSPTFQSVLLSLQHFWAEHGCLIWQPYYTQVGAGTYNPATFLRVLGPEPWRVAYVEPSIRPDDGRYGENPNRLQQHYQFQVILKPDPGNPQEIYLESLERLGISQRQHDIRFVEDKWEAPTLGAWGLGWEVWLDGQEITQFTYFQQAGGQTLDPVSVEITYGLERILIALQRAQGFHDIRWNESITYGEVNLQSEQEHSRYYFEVADTARLRQMFDLFEAEARAALASGLILPAHDYVLKCSHTFNVLDTRGAVGVAERAALFGRMRALAREVAQGYVEQRQRLEYPLLKDSQGAGKRGGRRAEERRLGDSAIQRSAETSPRLRAPFVLEVGTEELPVADLQSALAQLSERVPQMLRQHLLGEPQIRVIGTPRRLAVLVEDLAPSQPPGLQDIKGPPADIAFDKSGAPTRAAIGFAKSKDVPIENLYVKETDGGRYTFVTIREAVQTAAEVLAERLPELLAELKFENAMRWNESGVAFSRPIRWIVALHGSWVVQFEYAGVTTGKTTRGLRPEGSPEIEVPDAGAYESTLETAGVALHTDARRNSIRAQAARLAAEVGGMIPDDPALLAEVANLVEAPVCLRGAFDEAHLELPPAVLVTVMKKHQRYFPVMQDGRLLPYFVAAANGTRESMDLVVEGNEHVLHARFADADFFIREDLKRPLAEFRSKLAGVTFQAKLGSLLDKSERIERLAAALAPLLGLDEAETQTAVRAAHLCKADLASKMVVEMTSLQGVIGRVYALRSGEPEPVAQAIYEHYFPDGLIPARPGLCVGAADRLDSLVGLFAVGLAPTGAKDPFGLRRAALSLLEALLASDISFDIRAGLKAAAAIQPFYVDKAIQDASLDYVRGRLRGVLLDAGYRYDVVDAVLSERGHDPVLARQAAAELSAWVARPDWPQTLAAYARCVRIIRTQPSLLFAAYPNSELMAEPAEKALYEAYLSVSRSAYESQSVDQFFAAFVRIIPAISRFFEEVLVMTANEAIRNNRLNLLQRIAALTSGIADLSKLEGF